ncbi:hypothetical protein C8R47DRAFT_574394 [Mycena vitilis]|nr:hypothetical protein C8R47DRAFT_574394 [Mycena vitilis]
MHLMLIPPFCRIPADAQIVPQPPYIPEPPHRMVYGWRVEPALFGPERLTLVVYDDVTGEPLNYPAETLKHPTTVTESVTTFDLVLLAMRINIWVKLDRPHPTRPRYAYLAEASNDRGVYSPMGGAKIIPASRLKQLTERLQLVKDPEWIQVLDYSAQNLAAVEHQMQSIRPLNLSGMATAAPRSPPDMRLPQSV